MPLQTTTTVFATWCGPCKAISPAYEALASKLSETGKMAFAKVDVDQNQDIAQANNVTAYGCSLRL